MKRIITTAAAFFFLAAMISPSLAHKTKRRHSHKKPVATQPTENMETGKASSKAMDPQPPVESQPQKVATPPPAPTPTGAAVTPPPTPTGASTAAKPAMAPTPSQPSMADKATDMVKDKATDAVMGGVKPSGGSVPSMPGSNPVSTMKPTVPSVPGTPK